MRTLPLTEADADLIAAARAIIARHYRAGWHHVGAALRTRDGRIYTAVHLEANVGRVAVCAEAIALGKAIAEGDRDFATIVAVRRARPDEPEEEIAVVSPCGMCRELISDYGPDTLVIFAREGALLKCPVLDLLPGKYTRGAAD